MLLRRAGRALNGQRRVACDRGGQMLGQPTLARSRLAYQQQSGDAVVVYGEGSTSLRAQVWDGTSWGTPLALAAPGGSSGNVLWTSIDADPNSDKIAVSVVTTAGDIWAGVWDGSWSTSLLSTSSSSTVAPTADVAFESGSGELLVAYAESGSSKRTVARPSSSVRRRADQNAASEKSRRTEPTAPRSPKPGERSATGEPEKKACPERAAPIAGEKKLLAETEKCASPRARP